ncbi:hypothetical protein SAMN05444414_11114 [Roseovarius marisflavi]|uniref:Uncharacterized protein n=1 Tax=Roseovarius marisflavi TaxID=1054996 RepID=A0A1M6ZRS7_9RHOB|nr:hypothetical protein [Roseovarius marisflavi]SHL33187.1 hypothetical protein SAMN05444414_11114 [Roseovarius marisflavi]
MVRIAKARQIGSEETARHLRGALVRLGMDRDELLADIRETATDHQSLLRIIMREIDEAVLPRKMALLSDSGIEAMLVASNRRLIELRTNDTVQQKAEGGETDPEDAARAYAQTIKKIGQQAAGTALQRMGRALNPSTSGKSCSAARLAEVSESLGHENRMHGFLKMIQPRAKGWIMRAREGRDVEREGPEAVLLRLDHVEKIFAAHRGAKGTLRRLDRAGPSCSAFALAPGWQAIVARDGTDSLLAAVPNQGRVAVMDDWRKVFGTTGLNATV